MGFDKYKWKEGLKDDILYMMSDNSIANEDELHTFIHEEIDSACMYYSDCLDIMKEYNVYDWSNLDLECTNVSQVAYCVLLEETYDFDFDELKNETDD